MRFTRYVTQDDVPRLEFEVISQDLRIFLTRELGRRIVPEEAPELLIINQNVVINKSRALLGLDQHVLESDLDGFFDPSEHAWHHGEFQICLRRLDTVRFAEMIGELIEDEWFTIDEVNGLLERDGASFHYQQQGDRLIVRVLPIERLEDEVPGAEHPNIRLLVKRMDDALANEDFSQVLHASATIFETMAKDIIPLPGVQNQSLGSFFERYRKDSLLPAEILDYILAIYNSRSTTPLAGHGSTEPPNIGMDVAVVLAEMTKAFVRIEYTLHQIPAITS